MNQPDAETAAKLLANGYELHRPKFDNKGFRHAPEGTSNLDAYYEKQTAWWVSPAGEIVHWMKAMEEIK